MPCNHKFQSYLELQRMDFAPATLIVGTFNPEWPAANTANWFYGRTDKNYFWDVLPRLYGQETLINASPADWKQFCHDHQVAITDFISSIDDADSENAKHQEIIGGFSDKAIVHNFDDFLYVDVVQLLRHHSSIKNVYFTRGITEAFWRHLWNPVVHYCSGHSISAHTLLTPTGSALYQQDAHNSDNPGAQIPLLEDFILRRWQEQWHVI